MKQTLLLSLVLSCALPRVGKSTPFSFIPADTVAGHTHLVRGMMQTMCTQLSEQKGSRAQKLTPGEASQSAQQLYAAAVQRNSVAYQKLLTASDKAGVKHEAAVQRVAQDVQVLLWRTCSASAVLFSQLAQTQQMKQVLAARLLEMGAAETSVLQPVASKVCQQLGEADKQLAMSKRTLTQLDMLVEGTIRKNLAAHRPQLETFYSKAQLANQEYIHEILVKVMLLVLGQEGCGHYIVTPAVDE
jgi:hypothetical protein